LERLKYKDYNLVFKSNAPETKIEPLAPPQCDTSKLNEDLSNDWKIKATKMPGENFNGIEEKDFEPKFITKISKIFI